MQLANYRFAVILLCTCGLAAAVSESRAQGTKDFDPKSAKEGFEVGDRAPEIEGEDLDGVKFKLSDYRGKVVVIDFWGNW
jgi:cytochrome oxidase Cu insertion factor (SCO1/SenC/PrrC family)